MKKVFQVLSIILVAVVGSFVNFYGSNLIFSDVSNMFYGVHDVNFLASIPFFVVVLDFNFLMIYVYRFIKKPECKKASTKTYLSIFWILSVIGILTDLAAGIKVYNSFTKPYPFPYAMIIMLGLHLIIMFLCIIIYFIVDSKMKEDTKKRKITIGNSLFTVLLFFMIFLAFNRFGALLWCPTFIHLRTLYMTWPFYLGLLVPIALLLHTYLMSYPNIKAKPKFGVTYAWILLIVVLVSNVSTFLIGYFNTTFISVISPMLALERLATLPVDVILIFAITFIYSITSLLYSYKMRRKAISNKKAA